MPKKHKIEYLSAMDRVTAEMQRLNVWSDEVVLRAIKRGLRLSLPEAEKHPASSAIAPASDASRGIVEK